jgi:hypothetical protein
MRREEGSSKFMRAVLVTVLILIAGIAGLLAQTGPGTLNIYYIDTEGGQSTLFVGPTGESLLVDTGNAGDRDLGRIVETIKAAGVKQIDHMWTNALPWRSRRFAAGTCQTNSDHALLRSRQASSQTTGLFLPRFYRRTTS